EHAKAHRRVDVAALVEDLDLVGNAIAVGVLKDEDAIALGPLAVVASVVDNIADPDTSASVDIEIGGIGDIRFGGKEGRLQVLVDVEVSDSIGGVVNVFRLGPGRDGVKLVQQDGGHTRGEEGKDEEGAADHVVSPA